MRVAITGFGVISPLGSSPEEIQAAIHRGGPPFHTSASGQLVAPMVLPPKRQLGPCKNARYLGRAGTATLAAALAAVAHAGLRPPLPEAALYLGLGPNLEDPPPQALWLLPLLPNTTTAVVAGSLGIGGENATLLAACAASTQALALGARAVASGLAPLAIVGGGDSRIGPRAVAAYAAAGVLTATDIRPFDQCRDGFVPGEGAAVFVLEDIQRARGRGACIWGEVVGWGIGIDGTHLTDPHPEAMACTVRQALAQAPLDPAAGCVLAHGTGTPAGDQAEAQMLEAVFGGDVGGVAALKSWLGHGAAACGAVELAVFFALQTVGEVPPVRGLENPCTSLPVLQDFRPWRPAWVLLESFGFGGQSAALLIRQNLE